MVLKESGPRKSKLPRPLFVYLGIIFLTGALIIFSLTLTPVFRAEINYQLDSDKPSQAAEIIPADPEFSVVIPKIKANAKVIKNVDPFDSQIYQPALTRGLAHAKNTATPDKPGNTFIFAHSAGNWYQANQFNAVFYLLNKLEAGDEIIVYYQSKKYNYLVDQNKLVRGNELNYLSGTTGQNRLTLMTCWPPGTTLKRLIVTAVLQDN